LFLILLCQRKDLFRLILFLLHLKPPKAEENQDRDDAKDSLEGTSSTTLPLPAHLEDPSLDRKRKRVEELISSSTSTSKAAIGEPCAPHEDEELFDLLDS
jgi:hypothetical protein